MARWHGSEAAAPQRGRCQDPPRGAARTGASGVTRQRGGESGRLRGASVRSGARRVASASRIWSGGWDLQPESEVWPDTPPLHHGASAASEALKLTAWI